MAPHFYLIFVAVLVAPLLAARIKNNEPAVDVMGGKAWAQYRRRFQNVPNLHEQFENPGKLFDHVISQFNTQIKGAEAPIYQAADEQREVCSFYSQKDKSPVQQLSTYMAHYPRSSGQGCTAVFINPEYVLMDRNCLADEKNKKIFLGAGTVESGDQPRCNKFHPEAEVIEFINNDVALLKISPALEPSLSMKVANLSSQNVAQNAVIIASGLPNSECPNFKTYNQFSNGILSVTDFKNCPGLQSDEICVEAKGSFMHAEGRQIETRDYHIQRGSPVMDRNGNLVGFTKFSCTQFGPVQSITPYVSQINTIINSNISPSTTPKNRLPIKRYRHSRAINIYY
ncbi:uncharacterized protein [Chelonus insularis]|uniref:uncharacterized protein n=1 Tax=Chelonus insularis TaxID=460826 RepID=UPI00158D7E83|nr:uncharacterized protein LOC118065826 [Chelonus insularis]XP_034937240.1 uncharacterized protein LOC118065826 [Chelonus insularis]